MAKVFGSFSRLVSLLFRKDNRDVTIRPNQTTDYSSIVGNTDVQLPEQTGTAILVSRSSADILTSKTISGASNTLSDIPTTAIASGALPAGVTVSSTNIVDGTIVDADINASAAISLSKLATGALPTGITIASANIVDGTIVNADINASAAIDAAKIHDGSVSNTEFGYLNGVTSAIQTQLTTNATAISDHIADTVDAHDASAISVSAIVNLTATDVQAALAELQADVDTRATSSALTAHTGASSGVHGVTGSVVGTTDIQSLTNKTLSSPKLDTPLIDDYFDINEESAPGTPPSGKVRVYAKSDAKLYKKDDAGVEQEIGAGGSGGGVNYIANPLFADGTVTGWATYADAAGTTPVDGTGGSPTVTFTAQSGSVVRGTFSGRLTKDAANRQGQGASYDFTIDAQDTGRPVSIAFDYLASANFVANDVGVYIYDVTNATLITPAVVNVSAGKATFKAFFVATTSTSYRLILHVASTNASAWTLDTDNFQVGPQVQLAGAPVTDWQSFTPGVNNITLGNGSTGGFWRRVGSDAEFLLRLTIGSTTSVSNLMGLTVPFTVDTTRLPGTNETCVGAASVTDASPLTSYVGNAIWVNARNAIEFYGQATSGANFGTTTPITWATGDTIYAQVRLPIANWSSNVTMAERAVEEWAADDGSADVFGPNGALVPNTTGTGVDRTFVYQGVLQATDSFALEFKTPDSVGWFEPPLLNAAGSQFVQALEIQNTLAYGAGVRTDTASNTVRVRFGEHSHASGATYGAAGQNWSVLNSAGWRWRLRRVSSGAAVGFPVGARNVVGDTTGTAVPQGMLGQRVTGTVSEQAGSSSTGTTTGSISLPSAGNWVVYWTSNSVNASGTITAVEFGTTITSNGSLNPTSSTIYNGGPEGAMFGASVAGNTVRATISGVAFYDISVATSVFARTYFTVTGGGSIGVRSNLIAVRIA